MTQDTRLRLVQAKEVSDVKYVARYEDFNQWRKVKVRELKERVYTLQSEIEEDYFNDVRGDYLMFLTQSFLKDIDEVFGEVD